MITHPKTPRVLPDAEPASMGFDAQRTRHIAKVFSQEAAARRLPGAVMLVARKGNIVFHEAVGQQDPQRGLAMALDSIFRIYSMTKPIVSVAVMMLLERGRLLLDDPVATYLPEFADVKVAHFEGGQMNLRSPHQAPTVQDLLRHTAGLTYEKRGSEPVQMMYAKAEMDSRDRSNAEFSKALAQLPLMFEPGTVWEYSRATDLLGALVEAVSGQTLGVFLQENILGPLGMVDTAFSVPIEKQHRLAEPFDIDPEGKPPVPLFDMRVVPKMESGGAGLASTTHDYARFLQCLLNEGTLGGVRILSPHSVRLMASDHLGAIVQHPSQRLGFMLNPGTGFGLGFQVRMAVGMDSLLGSVGMYSWGGSAGTTFWVDPVQEFFAILMTQAPNQRDYYRPRFRNLVYAALVD
ncbi:MAG: beta-lactamase family protein [Sulfuritalea sp.]|nr:beta-lactamase family protein [Sulfuritalea sp.]